MQISREMRRSIKNKGVAKKVKNNFYKTLDELKSNMEDILDFKFENKGKTYDITPIVILANSLMGAGGDNYGFGLVHKHISEYISAKDYTDEKTKIYLVGANLNHILDSYYDSGLYADIDRVLAISKVLNIYKGDLGGYLLDEYYNDETADVFDIVSESDSLNNIYLSTIYSVALDVYSSCMIDGGDTTIDFLSVYVVVSALKGVSDVYDAIKVCMDYLIYYNLKEGSSLHSIESLSGDLLADLTAIDPKYAKLLGLLCYHKESESYVEDTSGLTDEEYNSLELYRVVRISATLDYIYKMFLVHYSKSVKGLKSELYSVQKDLLKENRSLTKKLTKIESVLKNKTKELAEVNVDLRNSKKNDREVEYKRQILELEAKLKSAEGKYNAANIRITNLEDKLTELRTPKTKRIVDTADVVRGLKDICEEVGNIVSIDDKMDSLKNIKLLVVGGSASWFNRLKEKLPNALHVDIVNKGSNYTVPMSTECVLIVSKVNTHSHVRRLETQLRKGVPIVPISAYRMVDIVNELYRELVIKNEKELEVQRAN